MELYEIKQRILNLKDIEFNRFQNWFDKIGCNRINKNAKSSKIRQSVLNLSDKDFDLFEDLSSAALPETAEQYSKNCLSETQNAEPEFNDARLESPSRQSA